MQRLDFIDLAMIQIIATELSFSAAASRLTISGAAVSKRLLKMENIIGHKIVHRPGPMRFTKVGDRLLQFANKALLEQQLFDDDIATLEAGHVALRIVANASLMIDDLPQVLDELRIQRPQLRIDLVEGSFHQITKSVLEGSADAGLIIGRQFIDGLQFLRYKTDRICVMAPLTHTIGQKSEVYFADVLNHRLIGASPDKQISLFLESVARKDKLRIKYAMRVSSFEAQAHIVSQTDMGVAVILESVARRFAKIYPIRPVKLLDDWAQGEFSIVVPDAGSLSPPLVDFVRLMTLRHRIVRKT